MGIAEAGDKAVEDPKRSRVEQQFDIGERAIAFLMSVIRIFGSKFSLVFIKVCLIFMRGQRYLYSVRSPKMETILKTSVENTRISVQSKIFSNIIGIGLSLCPTWTARAIDEICHFL